MPTLDPPKPFQEHENSGPEDSIADLTDWYRRAACGIRI
jgi:hypothetical protein